MKRIIALAVVAAFGGFLEIIPNASAFQVIDGNGGYYCKCNNGNTGGNYKTFDEAKVGCAKECERFGGLAKICGGTLPVTDNANLIRDILPGKVKPAETRIPKSATTPAR
jgi:hypothetical protein